MVRSHFCTSKMATGGHLLKNIYKKSCASDLNDVRTHCWPTTTWYKFTIGQYIYRQVCWERGNIHCVRPLGRMHTVLDLFPFREILCLIFTKYYLTFSRYYIAFARYYFPFVRYYFSFSQNIIILQKHRSNIAQNPRSKSLAYALNEVISGHYFAQLTWTVDQKCNCVKLFRIHVLEIIGHDDVKFHKTNLVLLVSRQQLMELQP